MALGGRGHQFTRLVTMVHVDNMICVLVCSWLGLVLWPRRGLGQEDGRPQREGDHLRRHETGEASAGEVAGSLQTDSLQPSFSPSLSDRIWRPACVTSATSSATAWRRSRCSGLPRAAPSRPWSRRRPTPTPPSARLSSGKVTPLLQINQSSLLLENLLLQFVSWSCQSDQSSTLKVLAHLERIYEANNLLFLKKPFEVNETFHTISEFPLSEKTVIFSLLYRILQKMCIFTSFIHVTSPTARCARTFTLPSANAHNSNANLPAGLN